MSEDPDFETVVGLLDDEYARAILTAVSEEPMTAKQLSEHCDASLPTVYRRVERLAEAELIAERTRPRPDGHHDTVYEAAMEGLSVRLGDGRIEFELDRRELEPEEDVADRFTRMWEDL